MNKTSIPHNPSTGLIFLMFAGFNVFRIIRHGNSPILPLFVVALVLMIILMIVHYSIPYAVFDSNKVLINHNYFSKKVIEFDQISNIDRIGNKISVKTSESTSYISINLRNMSKNDRERFQKLFNEAASGFDTNPELV